MSELVEVLQAARALLARPGNRFESSSWDDAAAAIMELDGYLTTVLAGWLPPRLDLGVLFAATGPIHEVAAASGWDAEYRALVERFERAEDKLYP